jgi:UDP-2-acetamido-3-amino-2,3-dideoxy-glucuronate N-acetyltransferase
MTPAEEQLSNQAASIHETATVEDDVEIGPGTRIWLHAQIRTGASIGSDSNIGKNVFIDEHVSIGSRVKIQNNVSVYAGVTLEDEVFVGPSAVFTNDLRPRATNESWIITPTLVKFGASIGANATIVCGNTVGRFAMVGAGSVVTRDVRDHELVVGNPARFIAWVDRAGEIVSRETDPPEGLDADD